MERERERKRGERERKEKDKEKKRWRERIWGFFGGAHTFADKTSCFGALLTVVDIIKSKESNRFFQF